jgi:hypothetical protein
MLYEINCVMVKIDARCNAFFEDALRAAMGK